MNVTEVARFTKNNFLSFVRKLKKGVVYSFFLSFSFFIIFRCETIAFFYFLALDNKKKPENPGSIIYRTDRKNSIGPIFFLKNIEDIQYFR
jgi:hypothetical protein